MPAAGRRPKRPWVHSTATFESTICVACRTFAALASEGGQAGARSPNVQDNPWSSHGPIRIQYLEDRWVRMGLHVLSSLMISSFQSVMDFALAGQRPLKQRNRLSSRGLYCVHSLRGSRVMSRESTPRRATRFVRGVRRVRRVITVLQVCDRTAPRRA